jgi:PTS system nitrogen regulatory IIA component
MLLHELILHHDVWYLTDAESMQEALSALAKIVDLPAELDREALLDALLAREELASTAIGNGIAIPHVRRFGSESLQQDIVVVAYLFAPVDWKAPDGLPVHTLFLVLAKDEASHLELLAEIAHVASDERFVEFLKTMPERDALVERIHAFEESSAAKS